MLRRFVVSEIITGCNGSASFDLTRAYAGGKLTNAGVGIVKRVGDCGQSEWQIAVRLKGEECAPADGLIYVGRAGCYPWQRWLPDVLEDSKSFASNDRVCIPGGDSAELGHGWRSARAELVQHAFGIGAIPDLSASEVPKQLKILDAGREVQVESHCWILSWFVGQALDQQVQIVRADVVKCFLDVGIVLVRESDPFVYGAAFVRGFTRAKPAKEGHDYGDTQDNYRDDDSSEATWHASNVAKARSKRKCI